MHKSGQSDVAGCSLGLPLNGQTKEVFSRRLSRGVGSHSSVHLCAPWPQLLLTNDQFNRKTILIAQAQGLRRCRGRRRHHQGPDRTLEVEVGSGSVVVRFGYARGWSRGWGCVRVRVWVWVRAGSAGILCALFVWKLAKLLVLCCN